MNKIPKILIIVSCLTFPYYNEFVEHVNNAKSRYTFNDDVRHQISPFNQMILMHPAKTKGKDFLLKNSLEHAEIFRDGHLVVLDLSQTILWALSAPLLLSLVKILTFMPNNNLLQ
ncbi:MAG: hypothetical protein VYC17_04025 [Nitrospinota bacterium]|nr:hypothetical protein [Nitrospinota bacterium]